jgi:hypothetical protein
MPVTLGVALALAGTTLAGCGGGADTKASAPASVRTPSASVSSPHPEQSQTPKVRAHRPKDPLAPGTIKPVLRNGKRPHPTVTAAPATFRGTVRYSDGVSLEVTRIVHGRVTDEGPGVVQGPVTTFSLSLRNGSSRPLRLDSVVVTAVYGRPGRVASPIYLDRSQDFAGTARPGATAKAVYTFAISVPRSDHVTIHVDFDAVHAAAVFAGSAS